MLLFLRKAWYNTSVILARDPVCPGKSKGGPWLCVEHRHRGRPLFPGENCRYIAVYDGNNRKKRGL